LSVLSRWENYLLPGSDMDPAVIDALNVYLAESQRMNFLLLGFSLPVIGFLILFIHMLSSLAVDGQRNEMTVMRSRGGSILTVLEMAGIEILFLAVASVLAGIPLSFLLVKGIGQIRSFLDFSSTNQIRIALTGSALVFGGVAVLICALTQLLPTISLAKKNVVSLRRERAEIATRPFWEWIGLDFLLLIATGYGYYLLRSQGGLGMGGESILNNPLLFLTPSLGICSLALLVLRIFPWLMKLVQWVSARTNLSVFYLAINTLTRSSRYYQAPMLLLVWSLSLSIFSASLAGVMERDLHDRSFYASGSELTILEIEKQENQSTNNAPGDSAGKTQGSWFSLPMSEYTRIPGVRAASRVAKYQAIAPFGEFSVSGKYIGLDRLDFPVVAFWRRDFADPSLGVLMNRLAAVPNGLIVSQQYLDQTYLQEGDLLSLKVNTSLDSRPMEFQIVGAVHFFPSWYPFVKEGDNNDSGKLQAEPVFIGNLEYLFEQIGAEGPYEIWLKTEPQVEFSDIVARIRHLGVPFEKWTAPRLIIEREQFAPERQGLFGVLSFGLLTSIILTCIGIVYFLLFSYRRRMFQLGILRALGLFPHQIVNILTLEIAITLGIAIGAGVASGYVFSKLFTPYLLVGDHIEAVTPPLIVTVAWESTLPILGVYLCLLTTSLVLLAFVIRRMKLPDTLKMGGNQ
jgi:putative ABC transport system permease protein